LLSLLFFQLLLPTVPKAIKAQALFSEVEDILEGLVLNFVLNLVVEIVEVVDLLHQ
jgi:hypothetical protein